MKWWKYIWLRIIYMTEFDTLVEKLKTLGISPLTKNEKQIIIFHLSIKQNSYSIIHLISHQRKRSKLIAELKKLGINESDLTENELLWIEKALGSGWSTSDVVHTIKNARSKNTPLADPINYPKMKK